MQTILSNQYILIEQDSLTGDVVISHPMENEVRLRIQTYPNSILATCDKGVLIPTADKGKSAFMATCSKFLN